MNNKIKISFQTIINLLKIKNKIYIIYVHIYLKKKNQLIIGLFNYLIINILYKWKIVFIFSTIRILEFVKLNINIIIVK